ncbi:MAG: hypothetical protein ACR2OZ_02545 [Verrucomicrobiales bacterium]
MSSLNESIVEEAAMTWFGELGYSGGRENLAGANGRRDICGSRIHCAGSATEPDVRRHPPLHH